ncbi:MAG: iron-containing alcohol dehydrogenase, partial [Cellvibrionaceae bacterium]|nr:iron-containing alcohol dehydrogenase [Cellvibrionaceae bacterium]
MVGEIICTATESVVYGMPAATAISQQAERMSAQRVFLLVSQSLAQQTEDIEAIKTKLGQRFVAQYSGMPPHAPRSAVLAAADIARQAKADLVVTVGGGSVTDAGKIVLICLKHNLREHDDLEPYHVYVDAQGNTIKPVFEGPDIPLISVPTTLSGGEFNPLGGATDENLKFKQGYEHRLMVPRCVILDPQLTRHTPEWLWFSTGVRAVDHAVEALASLQSNDFCDGLAGSALRLLVEGLPRVKADPSDMEARLKCQIGVWQSMMPIVAGVPMGASHAIGHVLGGSKDVPHGYTSCVMCPAVLAYNLPVNAHRQQRIATIFGS